MVPEVPNLNIEVQFQPLHQNLGQISQFKERQIGSRAHKVAFGNKLPMIFILMSVVETIIPFGGTSNENIEE
jgi:hypothetical protein